MAPTEAGACRIGAKHRARPATRSRANEEGGCESTGHGSLTDDDCKVRYLNVRVTGIGQGSTCPLGQKGSGSRSGASIVKLCVI